MKYIEVYHSSNSINSTDQIIREGFNPNYIGTSYGSSFGKGFYFSPSYEYTSTYNTENPYLIKCSINVSDFSSISYSISEKKSMNPKKIDKLIKINNPDILFIKKDDIIVEVVVFNTDVISNIEKIIK